MWNSELGERLPGSGVSLWFAYFPFYQLLSTSLDIVGQASALVRSGHSLVVGAAASFLETVQLRAFADRSDKEIPLSSGKAYCSPDFFSSEGIA